MPTQQDSDLLPGRKFSQRLRPAQATERDPLAPISRNASTRISSAKGLAHFNNLNGKSAISGKVLKVKRDVCTNFDSEPLIVAKKRSSVKRDLNSEPPISSLGIRPIATADVITQRDNQPRAVKVSWYRSILQNSQRSHSLRRHSRIKLQPLEFLDHNSLSSFAELLPEAMSPSSENESNSSVREVSRDWCSEHIAYQLSIVDNYIAPPADSQGANSTFTLQKRNSSQTHFSSKLNIRTCQYCFKELNGSVLTNCDCCKVRLCGECFGPSLYEFKFPRKNRLTREVLSSESSSASRRTKEFCQKCMKYCAGSNRSSCCRLNSATKNICEPESEVACNSRRSSRQSQSHQRQLTQMSLQLVNNNENDSLLAKLILESIHISSLVQDIFSSRWLMKLNHQFRIIFFYSPRQKRLIENMHQQDECQTPA
ncbi:uncharacterized protein V1516DRAFT_673925 [Lipomyces oligophaga]|uniref:uncharacterized protein n=1 Tax=Lipomyces oligophaga TaxID=45792 RepID=UPI0034CD5666